MTAPRPAPPPILVHTDGACHGNPGPGGWGVVWQGPSGPVELLGGVPVSTNNQMEMTALIQALRALRARAPQAHLDVRSDSQYVLKGITQWRAGWERRGWRATSGGPVKNADLWRTLFAEVDAWGPRLRLSWVRGHNGDPGNEHADRLALEGLRLAQRQRAPGAWVREGATQAPRPFS